VRIEALVLRGEDRLLHDVGDVVDVDYSSPFLAKFAQQVAVGRNDPQRDLRPVIGEGFERREGSGTESTSTKAPSRAPTAARPSATDPR
jgi:hypothetical protein